MEPALSSQHSLGTVPTPGLLWVWPFAAILLLIAILPLIRGAHHWWEQNRNKLLVAVLLGLATLTYYHQRGYGYHGAPQGLPTVLRVLQHSVLEEYVPFITLLFCLFVISGGILIRGDIRATPTANTAILGLGALTASLIGTTGASMVLIRLLLRTNAERRNVVHTIVFFIFAVSNAGGVLLPIGDPPLFLGYLLGVPFFWTLALFPQWLVTVTLLLAVYWIWDWFAYRRETPAARAFDRAQIVPIHVAGLVNLLWLGGVLAAVVMLDPSKALPGTDWRPPEFLRELVQLAFAGLSVLTTQAAVRRDNQFSYGPIGEVAALFIGIFITMQAPIEILKAAGPAMAQAGFTQPWQFFWASGTLSSFLDNAPTYVVYFESARALPIAPGAELVKLLDGGTIPRDLLIAVSCGSVFMGANTYIGNGPNFMVKSIAEKSGVRMPSFFGYMLYAIAVLIPIFVLLTIMFFTPPFFAEMLGWARR